ncbi:nitroreductase family deazaflavin-dependent oxidoreductase [Rhodococcus gannanensis]|uniref:Nitroreductase family deazaflavin-dependent oxidoreductase n=1 Tax=Rhodococcus gannanensis TaxID=1960308 RepID=A0ABW4P6K9_9NOCA
MPLPRRLARFNRVATNRLALLVHGWTPGCGIVLHRGRRTGRLYRTPVNVFRHAGGVRIALTYGEGSDWVRNVLSAGTVDVLTRGRLLTLTEPVVGEDPAARWAPGPVRFVLKRIGATSYLDLAIQA